MGAGHSRGAADGGRSPVLTLVSAIMEAPHVRDVHDLHASQIATGLPVLVDLQRCVADHFPVSIEHSTFQFELISHSDHEPSRHA